MTKPPRLYPGHRHQWASDPIRCICPRDPDDPDDPGEPSYHCPLHGESEAAIATYAAWLKSGSDLVRCTVCGLQAPRNAAVLDGRMTRPQSEQEHP